MREPIAVYNAATNIEAHSVRLMLVYSGVEAFAVDDVSVVGLWAFGTLPEIHKPQVWIDEGDLDRAKPILQAYEEQQIARATSASDADSRLSIGVVCEDCGKPSAFPASAHGKIRQCPHCGKHVDVDEADEEPEYWRLDEEE